MIDTRSKLLGWFYSLSLAIFILMVAAIVVWTVFFGGAGWISYWIGQILK